MAAFWPTFLTVIADFVENVTHLVALMGQTTILIAKDFVTPVNFVLAQVAVLLVFVLFIVNWMYRRKNSSAA